MARWLGRVNHRQIAASPKIHIVRLTWNLEMEKQNHARSLRDWYSTSKNVVTFVTVTMRQSAYDFLLTFYSNYGSMSCRFCFNVEKCRDLEIGAKVTQGFTGYAVAQHCRNSNISFLRENGKFDPVKSKRCTRLTHNLSWFTMSERRTLFPNFAKMCSRRPSG